MANTNSTTSYLDPPQLIGRPNADGTISITPLELKKLNDYNYYVAKMLQGGLNLANLNGATNQVFTDIQGNVTEVTATAQGLTSRVSSAEGNIVTAQQTASSASVTASNALGEVQQVKLTVDGLSIADETGSYTIIDGDKLESRDYATGNTTRIEDGAFISADSSKHIRVNSGGLYLGDSTSYEPATLYYDTNSGKLYLSCGTALKIEAGSNMSIDSNGTIYIGTSNVGKTIQIGEEFGSSTINLIGNVLVNGVPI